MRRAMSPGLISAWTAVTPSLERGVGCGILLSDRGRGKEKLVGSLWLEERGQASDVRGDTGRVDGMRCPVAGELDQGFGVVLDVEE